MRGWGLLVLAACVGLSASAQPSEATSNENCIWRMEVPQYPPIARQARVQGTILAQLLVDDVGKPVNVEISVEYMSADLERNNPRAVRGMLGAAVEQVLEKAELNPHCSQPIRVRFVFRILKESKPEVPRTIFEAPNTWVIEVPAPILIMN